MHKTPPGLWVLAALKMWESLSFYGMQALLVLYLTQSLGYTDYKAFGLYALYAALVELTSVHGGIIGDRFGYGVGSSLIMAGHLKLTIPGLPIYGGLALIVVGTGLFRPNTTALLGNLYTAADADQRESGYALFYAALNLGGFLADCLCGVVGETIGWHACFGLAAFGMAIGWIVFYQFKYHLPQTKPSATLSLPKSATAITLGLLAVMGLFVYQEQSLVIVPMLLAA